MTERDRKDQSAIDHDEPRNERGQESDVIPGRHGKHGGSLESEGEPQDEGREANPPREADDASGSR
jgi:hypothetical protein